MKIDNELNLGKYGMTNSNVDISQSANVGVIGKYSNLYKDFINGLINTGDYFYSNLIETNYYTSDANKELFSHKIVYLIIMFGLVLHPIGQ
jgi:hypothetical protein